MCDERGTTSHTRKHFDTPTPPREVDPAAAEPVPPVVELVSVDDLDERQIAEWIKQGAAV